MPTPSLMAGVNALTPSSDHGKGPSQTLDVRFRNGDVAAFRAVVKGYHSRLFRAAVHLLRDAKLADRATSEAFVRTFHARSLLDPNGNVWCWLSRSLIQLALVAPPRAALAEMSDDPRLSTIAALANLGRSDVKSDLYFALAEELDALPDALRTTIIWVAIDGTSLADVAMIVGAPEAAVGLRVHEARRKLRDGLASRGLVSLGGGAS